MNSKHLKVVDPPSPHVQLYDQAPVGYLTLNDAGLILETNLTASTLLGVARGELVDQPLRRFISNQNGPQQQWGFEASANVPVELRMLRPDKTEFWARLVATFAHDEAGSRLCLLVLLDISKPKQAEQDAQELEARRLESQKILAVEQLTGGIALDFNKILAAMIMQLGMLPLQAKVERPKLPLFPAADPAA